MIPEAKHIIQKFNLVKHPEGGYFSEKFRSNEFISEGLPERFSCEHVLYTSIYFLLKENDISAFHILKSDEIWHFYEGTTLDIHIINPNGDLETVSLGKNFKKGEHFQYLIKAGYYFAAEVRNKASFAFVGCTVSPGFEYSDFELCNRESLIKKFPAHNELINRLTKETKP